MHRSFSCKTASTAALVLGVSAFYLIGCGGGHDTQFATSVNPATASVAVSVRVSPATVNLNPGEAKLFTADVGGAANTAVTWSVQEVTAGGSINSLGLYTAPATFGIFHVIATSVADTSKSATATVAVKDLSGSFTPTSDMQNVRGIHTATLLPNGIVLVAGGSNGWTEDWDEAGQTDAELYNPAAGSFTTTASMVSPRTRYASTLLSSGRVLLTGGEGQGVDQPPVLASAELYDPRTSRFSATDNMVTVRMAHSATLLPNGKVLIAGGGNDGGWGFPIFGDATASAEIYDPFTDTFTPTGSLGTPRFAHTATLLPSGRVLIAGGFSSARVNEQAVPLASTEIYDPFTDTFTAGTNMASARGGHTATLLPNGAVLIAGGLVTLGAGTYYPPTPGSSVVLSSAELRDPTTGEFTSAGSMTAEREEHTATLLSNGNVLLVGGATGSNGTLDTAELYDPVAHTFAATAGMSTPRSGHSATLLPDGTILVTGGHGAGGRWDTGDPGYANFLRSAELLRSSQ